MSIVNMASGQSQQWETDYQHVDSEGMLRTKAQECDIGGPQCSEICLYGRYQLKDERENWEEGVDMTQNCRIQNAKGKCITMVQQCILQPGVLQMFTDIHMCHICTEQTAGLFHMAYKWRLGKGCDPSCLSFKDKLV